MENQIPNFPEYGKTATLRCPWHGFQKGNITERHLTCCNDWVYVIQFDAYNSEPFYKEEFKITD